MGAVLWPSFLAACLASLLFFAVVDPDQLRDSGPHLFVNMDREEGYALGFFFFWLIAACASGFSAFLLSTSPRHPTETRPPPLQ